MEQLPNEVIDLVKSNYPPSSSRTRRKTPAYPSQGIALVLVLVVLVLITGLVLAFFSSVSTELTSAKGYAGGGSSKQLADAATQLVIGTIRKATSDTDNGTGTDVAWASQPGMIRTWDNNGNPRKCYKLFSSDSLEAPAPYVLSNDAGDFDMGFDGAPALYTDLNAPVFDASSVAHYPVLDPTTTLDSTEKSLPAASQQIAGFSIDTTKTPVIQSVTYNPPIAKAPMPVRWMYVLQDGTLAVPTSANPATVSPGASQTATFSTTNAPSATNPIVGRIAYWTDDESCKVNINTASEGVYWDVPHLFTNEDLGLWTGGNATAKPPGLSVAQPAVGEYQRYPGHPATTSLSPILAFSGTPSVPASNPLLQALKIPALTTTITTVNNPPFLTYYDLVPRISRGGSQAGAVIPNTSNTSNTTAVTPGQLGTVPNDSDRLFASVDEFLFAPPSASDTPGVTPRQVLPALLASQTSAQVTQALEKAKFFLTAHSSAPEVTIFNTPRVSMWPEWPMAASPSPQRTTLDSTLAFCADTQTASGDTPYYFTRSTARSTTADFTGRNQTLYNYLQKLMSTPVPGFGGAFSSSGALGPLDSVQVLTCIYDYIRCINMHDATYGATAFTPAVRIGAPTWSGGEVLPTRIQNSAFQATGGYVRGFGRFATVSGMDLVFCGVPPTNATTGAITTGVQALLVPTLFSPMQGLPGMYPKMYYTITGQENFTLNGLSIFKAGGTNWITNAPVQDNLGRGMGSMISPLASLERYGPFIGDEEKNIQPGGNIAPASPPTAGTDNNYTVPGSGVYPFVSYYNDPVAGPGPDIPLAIPAPTTQLTTMKFKGGPLVVTLYSGEGEKLQTVQMNIPDAPSMPVPKVYTAPLFGTFANLPKVPPAFNIGRMSFLASYDVIRGVEVADPSLDSPTDTSVTPETSAGDVRMLAALETVPPRYFHAHQNWAGTAFVATGMEDDDGSNGNLLGDPPNVLAGLEPAGSGAGSHGVLAAKIYPRNANSNNPSYKYKNPYVPSRTNTPTLMGVTRTNGIASTPGDWDTGYALLPDGAHVNMGDIGDGAYVDEVLYPSPGFVGNPRYPYVLKEDHFNSDRGAGTYFSPSRQVPSSMMLGSIPSGIQRMQPWQTLLFNPKPEDPNHPGRGSLGSAPPDHLIADLFWMPVVEPYPISQPFSTAGKINMNYQIEPFNYITRATGIYALMKATKMMAIPASIYAADPKPLISVINDANSGTPPRIQPPNTTFRYPINVDATLGGFTDKFASNDIFRSATQIAELNLVPQTGNYDHTTASMSTFWAANTLTGDNLREKPYVDLYPRLTTKSNAYTVHFRVQVLQKSPSTPVNQWVEGKDQINSEYRGSSEIERYLDSNTPNLPDFATQMVANPTSTTLNLDNYYRYRVLSTKRFSPY